MALRAIKPQDVEKRLKALFFGTAGVGKTTAAIQFPRPYLIDTERGAENADYVKKLSDAGGAYFGPEHGASDLDEIIAEVKSLMSEEHDFRTIIIDPLSVPYNNLVDSLAEELGTDFGRHKIPADRKIRHLLDLLTRIDMNVIITSHAKPLWVRTKNAKGKDELSQNGNTFDCYGKLDYLFDLVFEVRRDGRDVFGYVHKTRVPAFELNTLFPFTYEEIATRYGSEIIEKAAKPLELATEEQVRQMVHLAAVTALPEETIAKWFKKAGAATWDEMPGDVIQKCIEHVRKSLETTEA